MDNSSWEVEQKAYHSSENRRYETLFTLANGYRGMRGALEFSGIGETGNFIAGIFDKAEALTAEIVNAPNPITFHIYAEDELIDIDSSEVMSFNRKLNMKEGVLYTKLQLKTPKGRIIKIESERFVSRRNKHRWGAKYTITPINFSGKLFVENIIDGTVTNSTFDAMNTVKHFKVEDAYDLTYGIALKSKTFDKGIEILESTAIALHGSKAFSARKYGRFGEKVREVYEADGAAGQGFTVYKYGLSYSSRDTKEDLFEAAKSELESFINYGLEAELEEHKKVWLKLWEDIDIEIKGDEEAQLGIRFNLFHLASSAYDGDYRISIAAKALHGEGYKGHVFWDTETFMLPFFIYTMPDVAKGLLMYRYNTLEGARANAKRNGFSGARFPWESADDGTEVTPEWTYDFDRTRIKVWTGEEEYHINSDITFAIWEYYRATGDKDFILKYGAEIFLDTAKFWQSKVKYNEKFDRYEINKVIGPDEFHEHINNNAYTNYLAKWSLRKTLEIAEWLKREDISIYNSLINKLNITKNDLDSWDIIEHKIYIPKSEDGRIIEQFEGYFDLKEVEIKEYDENGMPVWPDLGGLHISKTKLIKQADVIMLMLMLGEEFDEETRKENYRYYEQRTMHKSSLSPSMYSIMGLAVGDTKKSYQYFMKTIMTDLKDNQGNSECGIHAASAGGSWQSAVFGFGGIRIDSEGMFTLNPWIPRNWKEMKFSIRWKGARLSVAISQDHIELNTDGAVELKVKGQRFMLNAGQRVYYPIICEGGR